MGVFNFEGGVELRVGDCVALVTVEAIELVSPPNRVSYKGNPPWLSRGKGSGGCGRGKEDHKTSSINKASSNANSRFISRSNQR